MQMPVVGQQPLARTLSDAEEALRDARAALPEAVRALQQCHLDSASSHPQFQALRGQLANYVLIYKALHIPLCEDLVDKLQRQAEAYQLATFDELSVSELTVYADMAEANAVAAQEVLEIHKHLQTDLLHIKDTTQKVLEKLALERSKQLRDAYQLPVWISSPILVDKLVVRHEVQSNAHFQVCCSSVTPDDVPFLCRLQQSPSAEQRVLL